MKNKKFPTSKILFFLLLLCAVFLGRLKFKQYKQAAQVNAEKEKIIAKIEEIEQKNREIASSLEYFKSEGFKQRIAREQLNLKQPEEEVYSFRTAEVLSVENEGTQAPKETNIKKWMQYFFGR